jgi:anti-sigma factor RsiW
MCDEREPLLAYLYDEADPIERRRVEAHLETCETCREELNGLRGVRQDLLAWNVPEHESVWKPFTPARQLWSWRDVPAWTMAAAAGLMLALGAAGGAAAHTWLTRPVATAKAAIAAPGQMATITQPMAMMSATAIPASTVPLTAADLARLEERLVADIERRDHAAAVRVSTENKQMLDDIIRDYGNLAASKAQTDQRLKNVEDVLNELIQRQQGGR